jgi:hypothetical protein
MYLVGGLEGMERRASIYSLVCPVIDKIDISFKKKRIVCQAAIDFSFLV